MDQSPARIAALNLSDLDFPVPGGARASEGEGERGRVGRQGAHVNVNCPDQQRIMFRGGGSSAQWKADLLPDPDP